MNDINEARKILGVTKDTSKDEILKRYDILLKKHKVSNQTGEKEETNIDDINKAYNILMGYESLQPDIPPRSYPILGPLCRKLKLDEKKVVNFIHYNKVYAIVGLIALIVVVTSVRGCLNKVDPDFYFTFIGNIYVTDTDLVEKDLTEIFPGVVAPVAESLYITGEDVNEQSYAMQMKSMMLMAAGDMDIILLDKANFDKYAKQGALEKLDNLTDELEIDIEKNKDYIVKPSDETIEELEEGLYGVDVGNSEFVKRNNIKGKEIIASIRVNANNKDKAIEILKLILNEK